MGALKIGVITLFVFVAATETPLAIRLNTNIINNFFIHISFFSELRFYNPCKDS